MAFHLRDHGDGPFKKGDFDLDKIQKQLALGRPLDKFILDKLNLSPQQSEEISEKDLLSVFNDLLISQTLYSQVETSGLDLRADVKGLLEEIHSATVYGKAADSSIVKKFNRAILSWVYLRPTAKLREHERFSSAALLHTEITLEPLPPFLENPSAAC